jgi:hypothetical protein
MAIHRNNPLPPPYTGQPIRIVLQTRTSGQVCQNVFDYVSPTPLTLTAGRLLTFAANWNSAMGAALQGILTADTVFLDTLAEDINPGIVPTQSSAGLTGLTPTVAGHSLPIEMGATMSKKSALKGQHGRGRITLPAVPISFTTPATDPNNLNGTGLTAYGVLEALLEGVISDGVVNYSPVITVRPVAPATIPSHGAPIILFKTQLLMGTARRRKEGRGI